MPNARISASPAAVPAAYRPGVRSFSLAAKNASIFPDLVASAVGLDKARGDTITLRSLAFQPAPQDGTLVEAAGLMAGFDTMAAVRLAVLAVVALVLGLFVLRPLLLARRALPDAALLPPPPLALPGLAGPADMTRILSGEIDEGGDLPPLSIISRDDPATGLPLDPVARLRSLIEARQEESLEILRGWMEDREEKV